MSNPLILIASDHRGFPLKAKIVSWLKENKFDVRDMGTDNETRCDAMDYALKVVEEMKKDKNAKAILICGSGQAMAMTTNRFKHIRAALCTDSTMVRLARQHNDANVLALGSYIIGLEVAIDCVEKFLNTEPLGDRYAERRVKFNNLGGL